MFFPGSLLAQLYRKSVSDLSAAADSPESPLNFRYSIISDRYFKNEKGGEKNRRTVSAALILIFAIAVRVACLLFVLYIDRDFEYIIADGTLKPSASVA